MTPDHEKIYNKLSSERNGKRVRNIAVLNEKIEAETVAYEAYLDGVIDAFAAIEKAEQKV